MAEPQPDFLSGLLNALSTGAQHTYGQVKDDLSSLLQGSYNPGTASRAFDVVSQFPIGQLLSKLGSTVNPMVSKLRVPGGRMYHGTPKVFNEFDPKMAKSSGLVGPGVAYLTDNPNVATDYAAGATHGALVKQGGALETIQRILARQGTSTSPGVKDYAPNIRPYAVKNHESFVTNAAFGPEDMAKLLGALQRGLGTAQPTGFQKGNAANRATNVINSVRGQAGQQGQQVFDTLTNMLGPERTNQVLRDAGFQSISYPGGALMGDTPHRAVNVLDPTIMQNLFDALAGKPQPGVP